MLVAIGSLHNFADVTVNPCKVLAILFKKYIWPSQFKEQHIVINSVLSVKYLGVQFSGKLIISFHISSICSFASDQLNVNLNLNLRQILETPSFLFTIKKNILIYLYSEFKTMMAFSVNAELT